MSQTTLKKVTKFGKIGSILVTVLLAAVLFVTAAVSAAAIYLSTLPKDGVVVSMESSAKIRVNGDHFADLWDAMIDGVSYSTDEDPSALLSGHGDMMPPEEQEMWVDLSFFNQNFSSATVHSQGNQKIIDATTDASVYKLGDGVWVLIWGVVFLVSVALSLWMLRALFKAIAGCGSPFSEAVVRKMRSFSFSLLPVALLGTVGDTCAASFLSAGRDTDLRIQWGILAAFVVTACLVTVFKYGVQLQRESDETL
ncbi:MAG: hypothetical protein ACI3V3_01760 [Faecousia sp.]